MRTGSDAHVECMVVFMQETGGRWRLFGMEDGCRAFRAGSQRRRQQAGLPGTVRRRSGKGNRNKIRRCYFFSLRKLLKRRQRNQQQNQQKQLKEVDYAVCSKTQWSNIHSPVFTRGMKKKIDEVNEKIANPESPVDDRVDALYGFVADVLGEENVAKALGTTDPDEMDLNELNILYIRITREYDRPVREANKPELDADTRKALAEIGSLAKNAESIQRVMAMKK